MTFEEFVKTVDHQFHTASYKSQLRYGQYIMNELYNIWPEKYAELTGSDHDCFYTNRNVAIVLNKLEKEWNEKVS